VEGDAEEIYICRTLKKTPAAKGRRR
jgi:hypothetical protein